MMKRSHGLIGFFAVFAFWCIPFASSGAMEDAKSSSYQFGACVHFTFNRGDLKYNLEMIRQGGMNSIRDEINWASVERKKGVYEIPAIGEAMIDAALKEGMSPLIILCYGNVLYGNREYPSESPEALEGFIRYCEFMVTKLKGRVREYEIWNEWDYGTGMGNKPGSAESYVKMLKAVYPRLKAIDPDAVFIAGAMSDGAIVNGWLETMLKSGAADSCDGISIHPYTHKNGLREQRGAEFFLQRVLQSIDMIKKYNDGKEKPLYITEMGYPTNIGPKGLVEDTSAANLVKSYLLSKTVPAIKGMWVYDFQNDGLNCRDEEDNFGITHTDLTPKRAYMALRDISPILKQAEYCGRVELGDPNIWILKFRFKNENSREAWVVWSSHPQDLWQICLKSNSPSPAPLEMRMAGYGPVIRNWGSRDWIKWQWSSNDRLELSVSSYPWILEGDFTDVTVDKVIRHPFPLNTHESAQMVIPSRILTIKPSGTSTPREIDLSANWQSFGADKMPGIKAKMNMSWDSGAVYLDVTVEDERFHPEPNIHRMWQGDSLQVGMFQVVNGKVVADTWAETNVQIFADEPRLLRINLVNPRKNGLVREMDAGSKRIGNTISYRLKITAPLAEKRRSRQVILLACRCL